jgi:hypothetical protein
VEITINKMMRKNFRKLVYIMYLHVIMELGGEMGRNYKPPIIGVLKGMGE